MIHCSAFINCLFKKLIIFFAFTYIPRLRLDQECDQLNAEEVNIVGYLRTFALIVSAHPYCARKFARHIMHERAR